MAEMSKIIIEAECPACGELMKFETFGETFCPCGEMIGELTVNWLPREGGEG